MRVHPAIVNTTYSRWHFPIAIFVLLILLASNFLQDRSSSEQSSASAAVPTREVIVAIDSLEAGAAISEDSLAIEARPINTLPSDVVSDYREVFGKMAIGPIPAGYPLAKALLTDYRTRDDSEPQDPLENAIELKLESIRMATVALGVQFNTLAPARGARIAIAIQNSSGQSALVADEAWVEKSNGNFSQIRLSPPAALFLQEIRAMGQFSYFELAENGPSPFSGRVVSNVHDLQAKLGVRSAAGNKTATRYVGLEKVQQRRPGSFSSYAWVTGQGVKYSIDEDGKIYVINPNGQVSPLYDYAMQEPTNSSGSANDTNDTTTNDGDRRNARTGLEPLYPFMGVEVNK
ncbi:MAG: hypothetical protein IT291_01470 [Deltaproteobacteria bacterium]|nr:hypothetical protein [Deltaproteobacteria bacterium]